MKRALSPGFSRSATSHGSPRAQGDRASPGRASANPPKTTGPVFASSSSMGPMP